MSKFDLLYRKLILTKFFTKGWGTPENLKRLFEFRKIISNRETCHRLVSPNYPVHIDKRDISGDTVMLEGHFTSPLVHHMPGIMPEEVQTAWFQVLLPLEWKGPFKPMCLHLAGTGDHHFWRRRILLARPLLKEAGIGSIILENPYYGLRKPKTQVRSSLHNVSDLFVMGGALVLESLVLLHWCERQGYGPLGMTGISMGGHMASIAATNWHKPLSLVPCLSWSTASNIFTCGAMSGAVSWDQLQQQYLSEAAFQEEIAHMVRELTPSQSKYAFAMGQQFARNYPNSLQDLMIRVAQGDETRASANQNDKLISKANEQSLRPRPTASSQPVSVLSSSSLSTAMKNIPQVIKNTSESIQATLASVVRQNIASHSVTSSSYQSNTTATPQRHLREVSNASVAHSSLDNSTTQMACQCTITEKCALHKTSTSADTTSDRPTAETSVSQTISTSNKSVPFMTAANQTSARHRPKESVMQQVALDFMRGAMDECTHIANFSRPVDTELIIVVVAEKDAYVPRDSVHGLDELWPGAEVRYIDAGHISAYLFKQSVFKQAIIDAMERQTKKYYLGQK